MHNDGRALAPDNQQRFDLCIVGAGAAGLTLALELDGSSLRVAVLESGSFGSNPRAQNLNRGQIGDGLGHAPLHEVRFRTVGGTTSQWGGSCLPYDPLDFEPRPEVGRLGWPLKRADLGPYYDRAAPYVEIGSSTFDARALQAPNDPDAIRGISSTGSFTTRYWRTGPPTHFGDRYRSRLLASKNVALITGATATGLSLPGAGQRVERLQVQTLEGGRFWIRAAAFVLAMGGLETPRLLLSSTGHHPAGVGNERGLVGRFYSPHINVTHGIVALAPGVTAHARYEKAADGIDLRRFLTLTEHAQRTQRLLNCKITVESLSDVPSQRLTHEIAGVIRRTAYRPRGLKGRLFDAAYRWAPPPDRGFLHALNTAFEQLPNPESRVVLSDRRDALGMATLRVHHRILPQDLKSATATYELLGRTLGELGLGRLYYDPSGEGVLRASLAVSHHTGTTRMADTPSQGVVDRNAQVFGVENLFVASASVFPTSSHANPTFTIVAMAIRLADHLREELHA